MMEKINNSYMEYAKNPVVYKKINKAYISFVIDGTMSEDEIFINLFIEICQKMKYLLIFLLK